MSRHPQDNEALLRTLLAGGFEFAIVGGVAAVIRPIGSSFELLE